MSVNLYYRANRNILSPTPADFFKSPLKLVFLAISDGTSKSLRDTTTVCKKQNQHCILEIYGSEGSTKPYPSLAHRVNPFRDEEHRGNIYYCVRILKSEYHSQPTFGWFYSHINTKPSNIKYYLRIAKLSFLQSSRVLPQVFLDLCFALCFC